MAVDAVITLAVDMKVIVNALILLAIVPGILIALIALIVAKLSGMSAGDSLRI
jgi:hypothetical protein